MELESSDLLKFADDMPEQLRRSIDNNKWKQISVTKQGYAFYMLPEAPKDKPTVLVTGTVHRSIDKILKAIYDDFDQVPVWNSRARICKRLEVLDSNTDITYQVAKGITGIISERDFVMVRRLVTDQMSSDDVLRSCMLATRSVNLPEYPEAKGIVRGESGICGWLLSKEEEEVTSFQCLVNADPKLKLTLWVPYKLLENRVIHDVTEGILGLESFLAE